MENGNRLIRGHLLADSDAVRWYVRLRSSHRRLIIEVLTNRD